MVLILVAIILAAALSLFMLKVGNDGCSLWHAIAIIFGLFGCIAALMTSVAYAFTVWSWIASEHKTAIIKREYGTSYTREEVFFASDVIETVRQLDRKRYEVNGNLMRDKTANQ